MSDPEDRILELGLKDVFSSGSRAGETKQIEAILRRIDLKRLSLEEAGRARASGGKRTAAIAVSVLSLLLASWFVLGRFGPPPKGSSPAQEPAGSPVSSTAEGSQPAQAAPPVENPPRKSPSGKIALMDPQRGMVAIDLREREGVRAGQTLRVTRSSQSVGLLLVTEVHAWGFWAKPADKAMLETFQKGDTVEAPQETAPAPQGEPGPPKSADDHYRLAELLYQKGEFAKAEKECRRGLDADGTHLPSRALLDQLLFLQSRSNKASQAPASVPATRRPLLGRVTALAKEIGMLVISIGKDDGVLEGDEFTVSRGGEFVAKMVIDRVDRKWSAGKIVQQKTDPLINDDVSSQGYVPAPRAGNTPAPAPAGTTQEGISPQDWVDLIQARLEVQRARTREVEIALEQARATLARTEDLARRALAGQSEVIKCRNEVESLTAQLAVKKAETSEVELMLAQARRNLPSPPSKPQ